MSFDTGYTWAKARVTGARETARLPCSGLLSALEHTSNEFI